MRLNSGEPEKQKKMTGAKTGDTKGNGEARGGLGCSLSVLCGGTSLAAFSSVKGQRVVLCRAPQGHIQLILMI